MPFALIPFLLLVIPVLEIAVFIIVGREIGILATLGFVLLTAIIGSALLRIQGFSVISRIQSEMDQGRIPGRELGNGLMIVVAAVFLLTPGFVTDALGFLLFIPVARNLFWRLAIAWLNVRVVRTGWSDFEGGSGPGRPPGNERIVELDADDFREKQDLEPDPDR